MAQRANGDDDLRSSKRFRGESSKESRPGDWTCTQCQEYNFASRAQCRKCQASKPSADKSDGPKYDDWQCGNCTEVNFSRRTHCRRCGYSRQEPPPPRGAPEGPLPDNWKPGDWKCKECSAHNFAGRGRCHGCRASRADTPQPTNSDWKSFGAEDPNSNNGEGWKDGDWKCRACGDHQFASRVVCRKCTAPRVPDYPSYSRYSIPSGSRQESYYREAPSLTSRSGDLRSGDWRSEDPGSEYTHGGDWRPGDWRCPGCGDHQFASRDTCRRCRTPKERGPDRTRSGDQGWRASLPDDWGERGYAPSSAVYPLYNSAVSEPYSPYQNNPYKTNPYSIYESSSRDSRTGVESNGAGVGNWRQGDWKCAQCGDHQFASRAVCRRCGSAKPGENVSGGYGVRSGAIPPFEVLN